MDKKIMKLKNGTTVITHNLQHVHAVTIGLYFKVGSIYEDEKNNGITHLVEHLFFRQLDDLSQEQLYYEMQRLGAEILGRTYHDAVCFEITVVPKFFKRAIQLIMKILSDFEWNESVIEAEKKVVLKQIQNKTESFSEWYNHFYFRNTRYTMPIMGEYDIVASLTPKEINQWKRKYFTCNNACIAVTGNFSEADRVYIQSQISSVCNKGEKQSSIVVLPEQFGNRSRFSYQIVEEDAESSDVIIFFDVHQEYDYETVKLLCSILGEGCGSKLSLELRERQAVTDDVFPNLISCFGFSYFTIEFTVLNNDLLKSINIVFDQIRQLKQNITEKEFQTSIVFFTENQLFDLDDTKIMNSNYALSDFILGYDLTDPQKKKEKYEKITIQDLEKTAEKLFSMKNLSMLIATKEDRKKVLNSLTKLNL